jgi:hypothetical protein
MSAVENQGHNKKNSIDDVLDELDLIVPSQELVSPENKSSGNSAPSSLELTAAARAAASNAPRSPRDDSVEIKAGEAGSKTASRRGSFKKGSFNARNRRAAAEPDGSSSGEDIKLPEASGFNGKMSPSMDVDATLAELGMTGLEATMTSDGGSDLDIDATAVQLGLLSPSSTTGDFDKQLEQLEAEDQELEAMELAEEQGGDDGGDAGGKNRKALKKKKPINPAAP